MYAVYFAFLVFVDFASKRAMKTRNADPDVVGVKVMSCANAVVVSLGASLYLVSNSLTVETMSPPLEDLPKTVSLIMVAYLTYDTYKGIRTLDTAYILHHTMGLVSEGLFLVSGTGTFLMMWVHLAEASTTFLHMNWLMKKFEVAKRRPLLFSVNSFLFVTTFFLLRVVSPACVVYLFFQREAIQAFRVGEGCLSCNAVLGTQVTITVLWWFLNLLWFKKISKMVGKTILRPLHF